MGKNRFTEMEEIGSGYKYGDSYYRRGGGTSLLEDNYKPYTEYVLYAQDGRPYFLRISKRRGDEYDSEPFSEEGKKLFPGLSAECPHCGKKLNLTEEYCLNHDCEKPVDNPIIIKPEPEEDAAERLLQILFKNCHNFELGEHWEGSVKVEVKLRQSTIVDLCEVLSEIRIDKKLKEYWRDKLKKLSEEVKGYGSYAENVAYLLDSLYRRRFKSIS
ncbi:MAG: hypothetical protein NTZ49_04795 [Candidatus Parcubacteria bacterium]|nr:hypothetical protein [Candidatus Parcubacteria bacterium]